jgi:hypothetical protein
MSRRLALATLLVAAPFAAFAADDDIAAPSTIYETSAIADDATPDVSASVVSATAAADEAETSTEALANTSPSAILEDEEAHDTVTETTAHDHGTMKKPAAEATGHSMKKTAH